MNGISSLEIKNRFCYTNLFNNTHQTKMKQLEIYELQKRDALQNFINVSVECFKNGNDWRENKE